MSLLRSLANTRDGVTFFRVEETLVAADCFNAAGVALTVVPTGTIAVGSLLKDMGKTLIYENKVLRKVKPVLPAASAEFYLNFAATSKVGSVSLSVA